MANDMLVGLVLVVGTAGMTMGADLAGSEWRSSFMRASELPAASHMVVKFSPDGKITGNGGCNQFFGGYTISGNHIKIGPLASTRKGCPGLLFAETAFFATLEAAKSFAQDGSTWSCSTPPGPSLPNSSAPGGSETGAVL